MISLTRDVNKHQHLPLLKRSSSTKFQEIMKEKKSFKCTYSSVATSMMYVSYTGVCLLGACVLMKDDGHPFAQSITSGEPEAAGASRPDEEGKAAWNEQERSSGSERDRQLLLR